MDLGRAGQPDQHAGAAHFESLNHYWPTPTSGSGQEHAGRPHIHSEARVARLPPQRPGKAAATTSIRRQRNPVHAQSYYKPTWMSGPVQECAGRPHVSSAAGAARPPNKQARPWQGSGSHTCRAVSQRQHTTTPCLGQRPSGSGAGRSRRNPDHGLGRSGPLSTREPIVDPLRRAGKNLECRSAPADHTYVRWTGRHARQTSKHDPGKAAAVIQAQPAARALRTGQRQPARAARQPAREARPPHQQAHRRHCERSR